MRRPVDHPPKHLSLEPKNIVGYLDLIPPKSLHRSQSGYLARPALHGRLLGFSRLAQL